MNGRNEIQEAKSVELVKQRDILQICLEHARHLQSDLRSAELPKTAGDCSFLEYLFRMFLTELTDELAKLNNNIGEWEEDPARLARPVR